MRLIDADALRDRFQNLAYDDWNQGAGTTWANAFSEAADIVEEQPTADAVERKRGKWIMNHCSICYGDISFWLKSNRWCTCNFCPNCGAEMERSDNG